MTRMLLLALLVGCAEDLELTSDTDLADTDTDTDETDDTPSWLRVLHEDDGAIRVQIDATDVTTWRYLDLVERRPVQIDDAATSPAWHLGASRFNLALNGGTSGPGELEAVFVPGADFEDAIDEPTEGWRRDRLDDETDPPSPDYALGEWYDYDVNTHVLTPRDGVYVLRSPTHSFVLAVLDYYDDAGNSGFLTIAWRER